MKKFYIPTSTLNFNNILSSESISPKAFYEKREFGYSRWATVPENPFGNATALYDNPCYFERPKSDIEDHPLLIEVLLDETRLRQAEGFWYCDHTIYLAPTTTRFLFYTETDRTITLSMSESSLETKLVRLYSRQIQTIQKPTELYKPISLGEPCGLNEQEIEKDVKTNKMKGMLYGYYIGSLLSSDSDSVKYLNVLKEIHNIFAAILSSFEKRPTEYQNERLDVLFDYLNEQNADFKSLLEIISSSIDNKSKTKKVWSWIFGKRNPLKNEDKSAWLSYLQYANENDNKENQAIVWIKSNIEEAKRKMYANRHLLSPDDGELVIMDNRVSCLKNSNITDEMEERLCISWLNETLSDKNTHGRISTYKEELAKNLTLKAKEIYQDSWEDCQTRTYLNDLRRHIAGAEFTHKWNNGLLSSIAAVLIAGDNWEKLLAFMQSKGMTDYKMAFAFYATLNGFANLTRDFTSVLYSQDKNYVWNVYKEFYGQLFGESLPERAESTITMENHKRIAIEQVEQNGNIITELPMSEAIEKHPKFSEKKHRKFVEQIIEQKITNWDKIRKLSKGKDWIAIIDDLSKTSTKTDPVLFDEADMHPIGQYFYCDKNVWYYIEPLIADEKTRKTIKSELDWIQKVYKDGGYERKGGSWVECKDYDNKNVISHFYNNSKYRVGTKIMEIVVNKLKELYVID